MKLSEIAEFLNGELVGDPHLDISGLAKIEEAGPGDLTFVANPKYLQYIESTNATAVLISRDQEAIKIPHIKLEDPYLGFLKILEQFYPPKEPNFKGIHSSAVISPSAVIESNVQIGPFTYIGENVHIGQDTVIYPCCVILDDVTIGQNCKIYSHVSIREGCELGNDNIIHCGVIIGSDGFGFAPSGEMYKKIPQMGTVKIEDDVEIGANCTIDRATLGETLIRKGSKIDNLVQIAHNVIVGENTVIAAQTGVSGSTKLGKNVTLAGQVGIVGHVHIGDKAIVAAQSGVSKDIPPGEVWFGYPAQPIMKQKKIEASLRHLPELTKKIHSLEKLVISLEEKVKKLGGGNDR
jgi:UDP-3-O-[3-hydroxymyristoyl] glucosamine N-acyltransferase